MSKARIAAQNVVDAIPDLDLRDLCQESLITDNRVEQVLAFHRLYGVPVADKTDASVSHMSDERIGLRLGLILEELKELAQDGFGVTVECSFTVPEDPTIYYNITDAVKASGYRDIVGAADALGDISYVTDGFALELGFDLNEVIKEIQASNLTKLGEDGLPIIRNDGKVLKGPYFVEPDVKTIVERKY